MPPAKLTSPRFIVSVNGEQRCVAGFDGYAVLGADLSVRRLERGAPQEPDDWKDGMVTMRVGGLMGSDLADWLYELRVRGDEVAIRIADGGPFDPPSLLRAESSMDFEKVDEHFKLRSQNLAVQETHCTSRIGAAINGVERCVAGVEIGVLSCSVDWVRHDPDRTHADDGTRLVGKPAPGYVTVRAGGVYRGRHVEWLHEYVDAGDEVTFRLLGPGPIDEPRRRGS